MNSKACLLLHGFTGGPYEVSPLAEHLERHGWECTVPTLPGHDGPLRELHRYRYTEWIQAAGDHAQALAERYGEFDLVGFSMGGMIAAYLANRFPVRRLALLNTAVYYVSPKRFVRNVFRRLQEGNLEQLRVKQDTPIGAVIEFTKLVRALKPEFARITVPTYIAHGELDEVVHPRSAFYIARHVKGEKEMAVYPNSLHLICVGPDAPMLFEHVTHFLSI